MPGRSSYSGSHPRQASQKFSPEPQHDADSVRNIGMSMRTVNATATGNDSVHKNLHLWPSYSCMFTICLTVLLGPIRNMTSQKFSPIHEKRLVLYGKPLFIKEIHAMAGMPLRLHRFSHPWMGSRDAAIGHHFTEVLTISMTSQPATSTACEIQTGGSQKASPIGVDEQIGRPLRCWTPKLITKLLTFRRSRRPGGLRDHRSSHL